MNEKQQYLYEVILTLSGMLDTKTLIDILGEIIHWGQWDGRNEIETAITQRLTDRRLSIGHQVRLQAIREFKELTVTGRERNRAESSPAAETTAGERICTQSPQDPERKRTKSPTGRKGQS